MFGCEDACWPALALLNPGLRRRAGAAGTMGVGASANQAAGLCASPVESGRTRFSPALHRIETCVIVQESAIFGALPVKTLAMHDTTLIPWRPSLQLCWTRRVMPSSSGFHGPLGSGGWSAPGSIKSPNAVLFIARTLQPRSSSLMSRALNRNTPG